MKYKYQLWWNAPQTFWFNELAEALEFINANKHIDKFEVYSTDSNECVCTINPSK